MSTSSPATDLLQRFAGAVATLERDGTTDALVELYAEDGRAGSVMSEGGQGTDAVASFWHTYRDQFSEVSSEYRVVAGDDAGGVLEWETTATVHGTPVRYRGATVLELEGGRIRRSAAYFDPTALGEQVRAAAT